MPYVLSSLYLNQNQSNTSEDKKDDQPDGDYVSETSEEEKDAPHDEDYYPDLEDEDREHATANERTGESTDHRDQEHATTPARRQVSRDHRDGEHAATTTKKTTRTGAATGAQNFCFVCKKPQFKIARHFKTHVNDNLDIAQALGLPLASKERKELLEKLRNKGNFIHNNEVLETGSGSLKVKRRGKDDLKTYEYCIHCQGMFSQTELWRHMRRCSSKLEDQVGVKGRQRVLGLASAVKSACSSTANEGVLKMLSHLQNDDIASLVRNDFCLLQYAESLYSKDGHDPSKHDYIRQRIRELGRLLKTMRKTSTAQNIEDALKPANFMAMIAAVRETAGYVPEGNKFTTPSLALRIGHSLAKVCEILHCHAIMTLDENLAKSCVAFRTLYQTKWPEFISSSARRTLSEMKYNKPTMLPPTEDVAKLNNYLDKRSKSSVAALTEERTQQNYSMLAQTTLVKIILFNRRRSGEVSKMKVKNFVERDRTQTDEAIALTAYEKKLCNHFERAELVGKKSRKVAVLLTPDMTNALNLMLEVRQECGVPAENDYLFAIPKCLTYYHGHKYIKRDSNHCGAKKPELLRSTKLRKSMATTSQILNLKHNELDQLADFLGHDIRVHREYYRLSDRTIQTTKIAKLLIALEKGKLNELQGQSLDEIGCPDDLTGMYFNLYGF